MDKEKIFSHRNDKQQYEENNDNVEYNGNTNYNHPDDDHDHVTSRKKSNSANYR